MAANGKSARERADEFLKISDQFRLGDLVTEQSHPVTADLSEVAKADTAAGLDLLFQVDEDVVRKFREWAGSGQPEAVSQAVADALLSGGRIFFTGCGATGRLSILLDSIWRGFWQSAEPELRQQWENRTVSIMAGGDFALIKSVEGFEDITAFGRRQIAEHGVGPKDVVFAITEGGETSWVIGTAWEALERGAKVYFVYNNPDDVLCEHVQRSREVIEEPRIEKINLTTGPMAITGSTRMQATSIQLCVMMTVLEMALHNLFFYHESTILRQAQDDRKHEIETIPFEFYEVLEGVLSELRSEGVRKQLAGLVEMEEAVYRAGGKTNYFADKLALDVLTDTTERSPTFCTPPFRKYDDTQASESWVFLFTNPDDSEYAWRNMLKRDIDAVEWTPGQVAEMFPAEDAARRAEIVSRISRQEILKFKIGLEGVVYRPLGTSDAAIAICAGDEPSLINQLDKAESLGAKIGLVRISSEARAKTKCPSVQVRIPQDDSELGFATHIAAKLLLNALSTCIMVRLGRVMGNYMIYVVPSNLKLIDRATRYVSKLANIPYESACRLVFEVIEYIGPRMEANQAYPPVVGMAVARAESGVSNEEAERILG